MNADATAAPSLVDELLAAARGEAGLEDFGEERGFLAGLRVITAAALESELSHDQLASMKASWRANLVKRLRLVALRKSRPEIAAQKIEGPMVVIGLPRTGTSALVDLLAQDPQARSPQQWETANLFPPSSKATWATDERALQMERALQESAATNPIMALGLHAFGARLPDECNSFLAIDFWSPNVCVGAPLPRYVEWLRLAQPPRPYRTHRWILQHLQAHGPAGRWTLKSPFHCFAPAALLGEYPDAMLVQTHRDPAQLIASNIGLICVIRGYGPGHPGRLVTAREQLSLWGAGLQRCLADRADPAVDARVMDISHHDVITDPIGTLRAIYRRFDLEFTPEAELRAKAWLENPAQHKSRVSNKLEDFGVTEADVEAAFGPYRARFARYF